MGIVTGGTFADVVAWSPGAGRARTTKLPRDVGPDRLAEAVVGLGVTGAALVVHGTTLVTNAILEGSFARTALVTTRGFADVLEIARQTRDDLYDLRRAARVPPAVPPELTYELDERCAADGTVSRALADEQLDDLGRWLLEERVDAVAVCLLHAYANPDHERRVGTSLAGRAAVSLSHEVSAEAREYERASATVLNAAVVEATRAYVDGLSQAIRQVLPAARLFVVQSTGGMLPAEAVCSLPLTTVMSGPAAGVAAVSRLARRRGIRYAAAFDMGGTSTDVSLIVDGVPAMARSRTLGGHVVRLPSVGVESIAVGGGSIVGAVDVGALTVGPRSAGAVPGPACYGLGGVEPTITDAALVSGLIGAGGDVPGLHLRRDLAEAALAAAAEPMGLTASELAWRAVDVAQSLMSRALSNTVTRRGFDLRECTLIAYGGGGPVHAAPLAARTGISRVLVPALAPVFSALGCALAEVSIDAIRTHRCGLLDENLPALAALAAEFAGRETVRLGTAHGSITVSVQLELRYRGQNAELPVPWPSTHTATELAASFRAAHEREYGFATDDPIEVMAIACRLVVDETPEWPATIHASGPASVPGSTTIMLPGGVRREVPVVTVGELAATGTLAGPAILATDFSSITVWIGQRASVDQDGSVIIEAS